tara:strand:- start:122 stop:1630 length:1509 start_codon:yes stop_codon:yes gene_type:complete
MPTIPNLSKLTLIETEPTGAPPALNRAAVEDDGESQFTNLPPELGAVIAKILMDSYGGPKEVCRGLVAMMHIHNWQIRHPIGRLLGELTSNVLVDEQLWKVAFENSFGLQHLVTATSLVFAPPSGEPDITWAKLFHRMCLEIKLFQKAKNPATSIELDWKDNASWTKHETDSMVLWLQKMHPRDLADEYSAPQYNSGVNLHDRYFDSPAMQHVLKLRGASVNRFNQRSSNNYNMNDLLVRVHDLRRFLAIAEEVPMIDVDLSLPLIVGTNEQTIPQPYHRIIAALTDTMLDKQIVRAEDIKTSLYPSVMQTLVQKMRANPDVPSERNALWAPLCTVIKDADHVALLDMLMELGASTEPDFPLDSTPLMIACSSRYGKSRLECAQALLGWGADVNASRDQGDTPLSLACEHCDSVDLVQVLLENNADPMPQMRSPDFRKHPLALAKASGGTPMNTGVIITLLEGAEANTKAFEPTSDSDRQALHDIRMAEARAAGAGMEVFLF